jgi:hypothetical protein
VEVVCGYQSASIIHVTQKTICYVACEPNQAWLCDLGIVEIKNGEVLYAKVFDQDPETVFIAITLCCFMIV